ncbi:MAG: sugar phosphate isomerase/epimerase family protein [Actinomycetota bacterium]
MSGTADIGPHARDIGSHDLVAGYYTISGSRAGAGEGEAARASFDARVAAAAHAGYAGLGILIDDYDAIRARGRTDAELRGILQDQGIGVPEVEFLYHWTCTDEREAFSRALEDRLYRAADAFGAHHLNMGDVNPSREMPPHELAAERFAAICDRAAEHGLQVALEFLPWSGIPDAATAWDIVRTAGRPNGGINLDVWHHFRGAADDDMLRAIPPERIVCVAISDADAEVVGDLIEDTTRRRRLPGEGSFDLVGFLRLLDEMGVGAPVTVEILSDEQNARPTDEAARVAIAATRAVMKEAGFREGR